MARTKLDTVKKVTTSKVSSRQKGEKGKCVHGKGKMVTIASCALAKGYASTVVYAARARIVEGVKYASTVVNAVSARNVEGHQYASTVVNAVSARLVEGHKYAVFEEEKELLSPLVDRCPGFVTILGFIGNKYLRGRTVDKKGVLGARCRHS